MKRISTISSILLLGTTVSLFMNKWLQHNTRNTPDSADQGYQLYL